LELCAALLLHIEATSGKDGGRATVSATAAGRLDRSLRPSRRLPKQCPVDLQSANAAETCYRQLQVGCRDCAYQAGSATKVWRLTMAMKTMAMKTMAVNTMAMNKR
jgi:hypothetical protein